MDTVKLEGRTQAQRGTRKRKPRVTNERLRLEARQPRSAQLPHSELSILPTLEFGQAILVHPIELGLGSADFLGFDRPGKNDVLADFRLR